MARGSNQKDKLLQLERIFREETDEAHGLTMPQLLERLRALDIPADRRTVYQDLEELRRCGLDIIAERDGRQTSYRLASREFELAELKLLVDSVQASRFLTEKKSQSLIQKLESLTSRFEAQQLRRQVLIRGRVKSMNESIYYAVDELHTAIHRNCQIRFRYFQWNVEKKEELRRGGAWYVVSPWQLWWDDENYYLIGVEADIGEIRHYRVDKMRTIEILDKPREGQQAVEALDMNTYTKALFGMFGGEAARVKLEADNAMAGVLIDRFGQDITIVPGEDGRFTAWVEVIVSPQFFGWIIGLGPGIRIAGPEPVIRRMKAEAERLQRQYAD